MKDLHVETRPDERGRRLPTRFGFGGTTREIAAIEDRWPGEGREYFRLRGEDGGVYILRHDLRADRWELVFFEGRGEVSGSP